MAAVVESFYGAKLVNPDAKALARIVRDKAVPSRSMFLLVVVIALALVRISQELAALSFNYRASLADPQDADKDSLDALSSPSGAGEPTIPAEEGDPASVLAS